MAWADNRYSRFVATLKVVLLLAALAVLSTLFLLARGPSPADLPFTDRDLRAIVEAQRIEAPTYQGVMEDGRAITVTARSAAPRPQNRDLIDIEDLAAVLSGEDSGDLHLTSNAGTLDNEAQRASFAGDVLVRTADGYQLRTQELEAALDGSNAMAPGRVHVSGPGLDLTAASMTIATVENSAPRTVFKGDVHLIYTPESE